MQKWQKHLFLACVALLLALGGFAGWRLWRVADFPRLCLAAEKKQDWPTLEQLSREWSRLAPEEAVAWYWLGESLQAQTRYEEAVEAFQHVQISQPRGFDAAIAQMQILFQLLHKPAEALKIADRLLEADPGLPDPRRYRIYFLAMTLQRGNLLKEIREAIRYRADLPDHYIYLMTLEDLIFRDGDVVTHHWLQQDPDNATIRIANLIHRATSARAALIISETPANRTKYEEALAEVSAELEKSPTHVPLLEFSMLVSQDRGDLDRVGELLAAIPDTATDEPAVWLWRGRFAIHSSDFPDAEDSLNRSLELHPLSWQARHELSLVLRSSSRSEGAGRLQALAATGSELAAEIRRLQHIREAPRELLQKIGTYATDCGDWQTADGVFRRYPPQR